RPSAPPEMTSTPTPPAAVPEPEALRAKMRDLQSRGFHDMQLRLAEARARLVLSDGEHQRLLDDILDYQHAEAMVDAPFITVTSFDGATLVLQIPAHPEQSGTVRTALARQVRQDFSGEHAEQIVAALDTHLDVLFDGFGKFSQTYTIEKPRPDGQVHVATVASAEPTGDSAARQKAQAISGGGWFDREIIGMAHEVIVPTVNAYFPTDPATPEPAHVP